MEWLGELWRRLLFPLRRRQFDRDLEEEMRFHLDMKAREAGESPAHRKFGNTALLLEDSREAWGWAGIESFAADLKYAARALRKNPGFTAVAVFTVALGIGSSTAVFSVVNAVLLRPLRFRDPDRLMMVWETRETRGENREVVSAQNFQEWVRQNQTFEHLAAFGGWSQRVMEGGEPKEIPAWRVTSDLFPVLGVQPILGRFFLPEEERDAGQPVAILSYGFWQRSGGDRNIAGKTVQLDREVLTVVGVMPKGFNFPAESEMWFPMPANELKGSSDHSLRVIGKLKAGATFAQAQAEIKAIAARLQLAHPRENRGIGANLVPLMEQTVGEARRALLVFMGAVACVLLIACANVANLLLVRATGRRRELALRLSLGASRWRVIRSLLSESVLLALAGGTFGVGMAYALVRGFVALDPIHLPRIEEVAVNWPVMLYAMAASFLTGIAFGMAPALRVSHPDMSNWLKEGPGAPGAGEFRKNRGRSMLAAAQIAMAVVLLVGAGLLLRSFVMRVRVPLGFRPEGVLGAELPWFVHRRIDDLLVRLRALPGVLEAGASTAFPQDHAGTTCGGCLEIEGQPNQEGKQYDTGRMVTTPEFFRAAGMTIRQGRFFTAGDGAESPKVVVISEALARRDFPAQNAVGRHVRWGDKEWITIIGVAGNVKGFGVAGDPMPVVYFPHRQAEWNNGVQVLLRTAVPPASLAGTVRKEIHAFNPRILIGKLDTVENMLAESVAVPRFYMMLVVGFASIALLVSAVGVYGTINYSVARRTHEIGIRMALGAERGRVLAMILRQGLALTGWGVVVGLGGAWVSTRVLENFLFGVRPGDAVAFASASGVLIATVLLACYIPARRATRVDPLEALRHE